MVQYCFHQPLDHLITYLHLAHAAHRVHAHEAWCARGHSLHLALQALTVCVCAFPAPSFAARLITDVFVDKNGDGRNDAGKEMVCGRWREPDGNCKEAWPYHVHIDSIADPEDGSESAMGRNIILCWGGGRWGRVWPSQSTACFAPFR